MKWDRILVLLLLGLAVCQRAQAQSATVTWTNVHQTIDGFGASDWGTAENLSDAQADLFFSPTNGIGLSLVKELGNESCANTVSDLVTLQKAVARGAKVVVGMVSPPTSMKDSGTCGIGNLLAGSYGAYATYIVNWIKNLNTNGIPVSVISPINEPDVASGAAPGCPSPNIGTVNHIGGFCLTPAQIDTFIKTNLGPAMASAGLTSTQIQIGDEGQWFLYNYPSACMGDPACKNYVGILSAHGYGYWPNSNIGYYSSYGCCSVVTAAPESASTGQLWMSEASWSGSGNTFDASITDALVWSKNIHDYLTVADATGWLYWMLNGNSWFNDNEGLTDVNLNPAKRLYAIGNYSKFVRPGWVRIDTNSNPQGGIYVSAYKDTSSGNFAIVVINENGSAVQQNFSLSGFTASSVTPWVTSATLSLAQQSAVSVSNDAYSYALPAASITTFAGTSGTVSGKGAPIPPSSLTATVK
jgi:glucuronoarabinoxylan endo-1,4-beta-xylanase